MERNGGGIGWGKEWENGSVGGCTLSAQSIVAARQQVTPAGQHNANNVWIERDGTVQL